MRVLCFLFSACVYSGLALAWRVPLQELSAYDYHARVGIPLAKEIRALEESSDAARIVGGTAATGGEIPYQAGVIINLEDSLVSLCGGSILSRTRVLTAAHCWYDGRTQARSFTVVAGTIRVFLGGTRVDTSRVIVHPDWDPSRIANDIAVARILWFSWSDTIQPIALPSGTELLEDFTGNVALASGYGMTSDSSSISFMSFLNRVELRVLSNEECRQSFGDYVLATNICTSGEGGRGTCGGDSGGPLVVFRSGRPVLVGVVSFGSSSGCAQGLPAAFARVTEFMPWISSQL